MIEFKNVTKTFGKHKVLDDLTLTIPKGKITMILGKSGEGKSVTIKHIMGLMKPTKGHIYVEGQDITLYDEKSLREYRRNFGMLFQHAALFDSLTVGENVMFPLKERDRQMSESAMRARAEEVLSQVGLPNMQGKYPTQLSTGEKKRVGLARALAAHPKVVLYDEPTTGMDPLVSEMIDELITKVNKDDPELTSIVISHDLKAALDTGEYVVMLYKGKVQLAGSSEDFKKSKDPIIRQFFSGKVEGPMEFL